MSQTNIVPFGKYKGQPVEAMAADQQYVEWLLSQSWFRYRYANINAIIINNFQKPSETPEHNKIQSLFTNESFIDSFFKRVNPNYSTKEIYFEHKGFDVALGMIYVEIKPELSDDYPAVLRQIKSNMQDRDDPERTINGWFVLLIEKYTGAGATFESVKKIFLSSRISILLLSDIKY